MKGFATLYRCLDETTRTNRKIACLRDYFVSAPPADAAWAVYFLSGRKPKRLMKTRDLCQWAAEEADVPDWLFDECHDAVGDLAETISLLLPAGQQSSGIPLSDWIDQHLLPLKELPAEQQRERLIAAWRQMDRGERLVWNKILTGGFRVGVSQTMVVRALAEASGVAAPVIAHRLMGTWQPTSEFYRGLFAKDATDADVSRPYPFCLAHPLSEPIEQLGDAGQWLAEWKWDGIRSQCIRRQGATALWSRGEDLVTERFPELHADAERLPDGTVLDGEIVAWREDRVMPFGALQRRIGRRELGKKILEDVPVRFIAFDLLEDGGRDIRDKPLAERRGRLERLLVLPPAGARIVLSDAVTRNSWGELRELRRESRTRNVEGLMLKRLDSHYAVGRVTGTWWKWKIDPYTVDAVLISAQRGHGRRASLYTDYTFAIWDQGELVPFAKAYSGLSDEEIRLVDHFVRHNTLEKFGPVRRVKPQLVFELAFENIQLSNRHKSGIAVRFPRMSRWRTDKTPADADTLEAIKTLLRQETAR